MKPFRTFGVLERMQVSDFDLVHFVNADANGQYLGGHWALQLGGETWFRLPDNLVSGTANRTEEEVADRLFGALLDARNSAARIAYHRGKDAMRDEFRALLGLKLLN
jgi:hypothetical protein